MFNPLDIYQQTGWHPINKFIAASGNYILITGTLNYFKTGYYSFATLGLINEYNPHAIGKLDFVGLNYYSHTLVDGMKIYNGRQNDIFSHNGGHSVYPEGLYRSIQKAAELEKPIIITENSFSTLNDELKNEYVKKHLWVIQKAMNEGYDIRGYMWWAPIDCWGWKNKYHSFHGFYGVDRQTKDRYFRSSAAEHLMKTIETSR